MHDRSMKLVLQVYSIFSVKRETRTWIAATVVLI